MKQFSTLLILLTVFTIPVSAQIDLLFTSSSAFYVSESCKSTKKLADEVSTNILFELSKIRHHILTVDKFILTNEYDNTYTGILDMHDDVMLVKLPVEVVYDGSSARWTIPPLMEWALTPTKKVLAKTQEKEEIVIGVIDLDEEEEVLYEKVSYGLEEAIVVEVIEGREEVEGDAEVPFAEIETVPVFPDCKVGNNEVKKACMNKKISKFFAENFDSDLCGELGLGGIQKISVFFKIDKNGDIVDIKARGPHPRLEQEAIRVVGLLPKMKPGEQNGKPVIAPYYLPIKFQVN